MRQEFSSSSGSRGKRKKAWKVKNLEEGRQTENGFSIPEGKWYSQIDYDRKCPSCSPTC